MSDVRVFKFLSIGIAVTFFAVGYVHQQIEIVKVGYSLQKDRAYLSSLVDQNSKLMYNLSRLESPKNLLKSLGDKEIRFATRRIAREGSYQIAQVDTDRVEVKESIVGKFMDLFSPNAEARQRK